MDCHRVHGVLALLVGLLMGATGALALDWDPDCIQEPVGFGRGTFGGEGGEHHHCFWEWSRERAGNHVGAEG